MAGWCISLSKPERGFWVIVVLAAIAVLIYEWVLVVTDFANFPYRSHVIYQDDEYLELPNILLCPRDPINYTIANKQIVAPNQANTALALATIRYIQQMTYPSGISPSLTVPLTQYEIDAANQQWPAFYAQSQYNNDKWRAYLDLHWQCEGMVKRCQVGDGYNMTAAECCRQIAMPLTTAEGYCIQFQLPYQYIPSYLGGFHMDLEVRTADLQSSGAGFQGIDVFIGSPVQKPMYPSLRLQRDEAYNVKVKAQSYRKGNTRRCDMHMAENFGEAVPYINATLNCTAKIIWSRCQCYPFFKLQTDNRDQNQVCSWELVRNCANETLRLMRERRNVTAYYNQNYQHICGEIQPPCDWMKYDTVVDQNKEDVNAFNNFATRMTFYYDDFETMLVEQYFAPNFHDVIIQMGGALVFWFVVVHLLIYIAEGFKMCCVATGLKTKNKIDDAEMMGAPTKGHHPPPIVTHHISNDIQLPRHHLEPLPPIPVVESHQETQTAS